MEAKAYREKMSVLRRDSGSLLRCEATVYLGAVPALDSEIDGVLELRSRGIIFYSAASGYHISIVTSRIVDATVMALTEADPFGSAESESGALVIERVKAEGGEKLAFRVDGPAILAAAVRKLRDDSRKATPAGEDVFTRIKKLAELRDAGVLTEGEFTAKKVELLKEV